MLSADHTILPLRPFCGGRGEAAILHGYMEKCGGLWVVEPWAMGNVNLSLGGNNPDLEGTRKVDAIQFSSSGTCRIHSAHAEDKSDEAVLMRLKEIQRLWVSAEQVQIIEAKSTLQRNEGWAVIGQAITAEFAMRFSYGETNAKICKVIVVGDSNLAMRKQAEEVGLEVEEAVRCNCTVS